jgi:hypothetical protein
MFGYNPWGSLENSINCWNVNINNCVIWRNKKKCNLIITLSSHHGLPTLNPAVFCRALFFPETVLTKKYHVLQILMSVLMISILVTIMPPAKTHQAPLPARATQGLPAMVITVMVRNEQCVYSPGQ